MKKSLLAFCLMGVTLWSNAYGQEKKVGIYTNDPKATLDVNGNVRVRTVPKEDNPKAENQLFWNKTTGEIQLKEKKEEKPFYVLEYRLFTAGDKDHLTHRRGAIYDFNTQIPSDKYEVLITDVYPVVKHTNGKDVTEAKKKAIKHVSTYSDDYIYYQNCNEYEKYVHALGVTGGDAQGNLKLNPIRRTLCKPVNKKWHISMEYVRASPPDGYRLQWHVRLLAINKNFAESRTFVSKTEPTPEVTGTEPATPTGALSKNPLQRNDNFIE